MNIQDELQKIHHKFGVSEMANYKIEQFIESLVEKDRAEQLILNDSSLQLNDKEEQVIEGIDTIYLDKNGNEMVLLSNVKMTIEQYRKYTGNMV